MIDSHHIFHVDSLSPSGYGRSAYPRKQYKDDQLHQEHHHLTVDQKRIDRKLRRIRKQKVKLMREYMESKSEKQSLQQQVKSLVPIKYRCVEIPRQLNSLLSFIFNGFIYIEINDIATDCYIERYGIRLGGVHKMDRYFSVSPLLMLSYSKQFDAAVYLLESQQDMQSYEIAQNLKKYAVLSSENQTIIHRFLFENRLENEELDQLRVKRQAFREQRIEEMIKQEMQEDDFFFFSDGGLNFSEGVVQIGKFSMSKNFFALIGIDEENVESFLMRRDAFCRSIPFESRKRITAATLQIRVMQEEEEKKVKDIVQLAEESGKQFSMKKQEKRVLLSGFEFCTLDNIRIFCDVTVKQIALRFPSELALSSEYAKLNDLEYVQCISFAITPAHLDQIIQQRGNGDISLFSLQEDFEYSVNSSMFIEKFYPNQFRTLDPFSFSSRVGAEEEEESLESDKCEAIKQEKLNDNLGKLKKFKKKRCKYRLLA